MESYEHTVLTVAEAAAEFKTSRQQIRKMIREELLPAVKVGREWRIPLQSLHSYLEEVEEVEE